MTQHDDEHPAQNASALSPDSAVVGSGDRHADEPMTDEQAVRLRQLCEKHDEAFDGSLTREQAEARIEAMSRG